MLSTLLREATGAIHKQIEQLPLAQAMANGVVTRSDYVQLLQHLLAAHQAWEPHASSVTGWSQEMSRIELLERDLSALGADPIALDHPSIDNWLADLYQAATTVPEAWLGVLYLFEGSRLGSLFLAKSLARSLGVSCEPGRGLDYHLDGASHRGQSWNRFKSVLDSLPLAEHQCSAITHAAVRSFEMLYDVYDLDEIDSSSIPMLTPLTIRS